MPSKLSNYIRYARTLPLAEVFRRGPSTILLETRQFLKHQKWMRRVPECPNRAIQAGLSGLAKFPYPDFDAWIVDLQKLYCESVPDRYSDLLAQADRFTKGNFKLLGNDWTNLGLPPDWHKDYKSGHIWPADIPSHLIFNYTKSGPDIKFPWELSRSLWLPCLGIAWRFTGDERYAAAAGIMWRDWLDKNPPARGVNWGCAMDVGIRAVNWIWGLALLKSSPLFDDTFQRLIVQSLWMHGIFIRDHLERSPYFTSNHYLGDLAGLFHLGLLFKDDDAGADWYDLARSELLAEFDKQILSDGGDAEASIYYHRLVLELLAVCAFTGDRFGFQFEPYDKWQRMFTFVETYLKPDGSAPQIGDNDSGRLMAIEPREISNHEYLLDWGAVILGRSELKLHSSLPSIESLIMGGALALEKWKSLDKISIKKEFKISNDFGLCVSVNDKQGDYGCLFAGPIGQFGRGGHAHNDKLSIEMMAGGRPFIVDPGTGVYTANLKIRHELRKTYSHSVAAIRGQEQSLICKDSPFLMVSDPKAQIEEARSCGRHNIFRSSHQGWMNLNPPVKHIRAFEHWLDDRTWIVNDRFVVKNGDKGGHEAVLYFILHPDVELLDAAANFWMLSNHGVLVKMSMNSNSIVKLSPALYSPEYGIWVVTNKIEIAPSNEIWSERGHEIRFSVFSEHIQTQANCS